MHACCAAELVAVGSRTQAKADAFVAGVEWARGAEAYGSYDAVIQDARVHAVSGTINLTKRPYWGLRLQKIPSFPASIPACAGVHPSSFRHPPGVGGEGSPGRQAHLAGKADLNGVSCPPRLHARALTACMLPVMRLVHAAGHALLTWRMVHAWACRQWRTWRPSSGSARTQASSSWMVSAPQYAPGVCSPLEPGLYDMTLL
jgi:hypothetical protein